VSPVAAAIGAFAVGAIVVWLGLRSVRNLLRKPPHFRSNYRGRPVLATAGVVLVFPLAAAVGFAAAIRGGGLRTAGTILWTGAALACLGYLDDAYGDRRAGGLWGHARELVRGHFTTGLLKAGGGAVVGLAAAWSLGLRGGWIVAGGAVVALAANMANLLDVRPGRAIKAWLPCAAALVAFGIPAGGTTTTVALGGGLLAFLVWEMREEVMLGDTGAGLVGGALGVAAVASLGDLALLVVLGALAALTVVSEVVSFTSVIEAVPPLRWVDRLGRAG
jgi:UDP-N-acetylmuramyl pentapeptide phosphotransferase/UDP-N-acetylglucosamine-1-phosphate transferase